MTIKDLNETLLFYEKKRSIWGCYFVNCRIQDKWFIKWQLEENEKEINKISKRIHFIKALNKNKRLIAQKIKEEPNLPKKEVIKKYQIKTVDLEELKKIPIKQILDNYGIKVSSAGFFKLRNEKTASVKLFEDTNSYCDFGSMQGGSVIDLIMNLEKTTVTESINILKDLI